MLRIAALVVLLGAGWASRQESEEAAETDAFRSHVEKALGVILSGRSPKEGIDYAKVNEAVQILIDSSACEAVPKLVEFVRTEKRSHPLRHAAFKSIAEIGDESVVGLLLVEYEAAGLRPKVPIDGLRRLAPRAFAEKLLEDIKTRKKVVKSTRAFAELGETSMLPRVIALLKHSDPVVRQSAARILCWMPDKKAVPALREALKRHGDFETHAYSAHALHYLGIDDGLPVLVANLHQPIAFNLHGTGQAIAEIAREKALDLYAPLLEHSNPVVRRNALVCMRSLLDSTDSYAPESVQKEREGDVMRLTSVDRALKLCYPLIFDEDKKVAGSARYLFKKATGSRAKRTTPDKELAMSIVQDLSSAFFGQSPDREQVFRGLQTLDRVLETLRTRLATPLPVRFSFFSEDLPRSPFLFLCTQDGTVELSTNLADGDRKRTAMHVSLRRVSVSEPFLTLEMWFLDRICTVLFRWEEGDWKLKRVLSSSTLGFF